MSSFNTRPDIPERFLRNNMEHASSPYLQKHKNSPIHWQEWGPTVLEYARKHNKIIFVSVGYSTCHWCHVMANDSFQDPEVAQFLNEHFVSIKVDREQRPDIDSYLMAYAYKQQGTGGWPLNVFLTPDLKPFAAVTYVGPKPQFGMPSFMEVLRYIKDFYENKRDSIKPFESTITQKAPVEGHAIVPYLETIYDQQFGGFGTHQKFPPHNTLLFLLHYYDRHRTPSVKKMLEHTLDIMAMRGLHDHLQGGFFRYCVDPLWTIPHFEKMLYDQALLLWVYSGAYKVFAKPSYKHVAKKIIQCLNQTFAHEGLFYSGHDSSINHQEGISYLWANEEIKELLTPEEYNVFTYIYQISPSGNFAGKNHLIKKDERFLPTIEAKLLEARRSRSQPFIDKKFITSWNALTGIAFIMAHRYIGYQEGLEKAEVIFDTLIEKHTEGNIIFHSSINSKVQGESFLEDYASLLLLATYLGEETNSYKDYLAVLSEDLQKQFYRKGVWYEALPDTDFTHIPASTYDQPMPSSRSLAEFALLRTDILLGRPFHPDKYLRPVGQDFLNLTVFIKNGNFHIIQTPKKISWDQLPFNAIQLSSNTIEDCYAGTCYAFKTIDELLDFLSGSSYWHI